MIYGGADGTGMAILWGCEVQSISSGELVNAGFQIKNSKLTATR